MPKIQDKDYMEKLINHTMQHGRKAAAIGLLVKTFSLFGQKLIRQKAPDSSVGLRRSRSRPQLLSVPLCKVTLSKVSLLPLGYTKRFANIEADGFASESVISAKTSIESERAALRLLTGTAKARTGTGTAKARTGTGTAKARTGTGTAKARTGTGKTKARTGTGTAKARTGAKGEAVASPGSHPDKRSIKQYVKDAISNVKPTLETRKKKIAGITRHIPSIVPPSRGEGLAIRWLVTAARDKQRKTNKGFVECLSNEFLDAYLKRGEVRHKRDSLHKLAESNRSYMRYRWW